MKVRAARRLLGTRVGARPTVVHMSLAGRIKTMCPGHALETQTGKNMEPLRSEAALQQFFHSGCRWRKRGTITTRPSIVETRDVRVSGSKGQRAHFRYMLQERKRGKVERIWGARQETEGGGTL